ncbi:MAG: Ni/Fe hydrogenase [Peptococcaceae bacterium BICA1-8]|nr:MAG: Ni/Fe hydrogenase [Peptococcaceae bacterium BICA1-8]
MAKITVNPITRISGFLEIEVTVENNRIIDAKSSGMLFRGFEKMLKGRPPLDAVYFTERICGICSTAHSLAATLALEYALDIEPNENARMIRDFVHGCEFLQNHIRHFYQYTLPDYIKGPNIHPLINNYSVDLRLPPDRNDKLVQHYLESTKYSRLAHEMLAELAGKAPHNHGIFIGGVTVKMDADKWIKVRSILDSILSFVKDVMLEDVYTIARYYPDYFLNGSGYGNLLSYGLYNTYKDREAFYVNPGIFKNGTISSFDENMITENIKYAWYEADQIENKPTDEVEIEADRYKEKAYSWVKAPRYNDVPFEVGPLARMWISGIYNNGISTMDRTIARVLEVIKIAEIMQELLKRVELKPSGQRKYSVPDQAEGKGLIDTTRGGLGHWIDIKNQKINHYEIITPTSWNLSPRDTKLQRGPVEEALFCAEIKDIENPVEIGRIVRSFDPCVSCATH